MDECFDSLGMLPYSLHWIVKVDTGRSPSIRGIGIRPPSLLITGYTNFGDSRLDYETTPATFQRAIYVIISGLKWRTRLVYLDDVIIYSTDRETPLRHVDEALALLREAGLSLKLAKCHFFKDTVDYFGHVIRPGRLGVAENNTDSLKGATLPRTQTELRSFLGLCNVYRRFVPRFAALAAPLNIYLTKVNPPVLGELSEAARQAF
jgi:Reverse transcriptase (RNA-dependent DNA polymerase)